MFQVVKRKMTGMTIHSLDAVTDSNTGNENMNGTDADSVKASSSTNDLLIGLAIAGGILALAALAAIIYWYTFCLLLYIELHQSIY